VEKGINGPLEKFLPNGLKKKLLHRTKSKREKIEVHPLLAPSFLTPKLWTVVFKEQITNKTPQNYSTVKII
jgi:hypothetical protein